MESSPRSSDPELLLDQTVWVRDLARSLALDHAGADDVAQEALLAALQAPPEVDDSTRMRAWLSRVVLNLSNLRVRRDSRRRDREEWAARPEPMPSVADTVARASELRLVVDQVMELDEPYRSTILLRYFDGLPTARVAEAMSCTPEAVRKRLSRALQQLRERLDRKHGGDGTSWLAALIPLMRDWSAPVAPLGTAETIDLSREALQSSTGAGGVGGVGGVGGATGAAGVTSSWTLLASLALLVGGGIAVSQSAAVSDRSVPALETEGTALASLAASAIERSPELATPRQSRGLDPGTRARALEAQPFESLDTPPLRRDQGEPESGPAVAAASLRGFVFDLAGAPVAGAEVVDANRPGELLGITLEDGSFEALGVPGSKATLELRASGHDPVSGVMHRPAYVTVRSADVRDWTSEARPMIVAAPAFDASGIVVDAFGAPVEGASLELVIAPETLHAFPRPLHGTTALTRRTVSGRDGRFELVDWFRGQGSTLRVEHQDYSVRELALTAESPNELRIELGIEPLRSLRGIVRHRDGVPARGARIALGPWVATTDTSGEFELSYRAVASDAVLSATYDGFRAARIANFGTRLDEAEYAMPVQELVLGGPLRSLRGVVRDADSRAAAGWSIFALPTSGESGDDALATAMLFDEEAPGWSVTDEDGQFALDGLDADSLYVLHAVNTKTLVMVRSETVETDQDRVELVVADSETQRVAGRVVDRSGRPLSDARVTVVLELPGMEGPVELEGASSRTDGRGRFSLENVPGAFVDLRVDHVASAVSVIEDLDAIPNPSWFDIQIAETRFLRVLDAGPGVDQVAFVDALGMELGSQDGLGHSGLRAPIRSGGSAVLAVAEGTQEVVAYSEGEEVGRYSVGDGSGSGRGSGDVNEISLED